VDRTQLKNLDGSVATALQETQKR